MAILIGGPTASGKTQLAYELQSRIPSVIINSDSMQVYNDLKILTNIPSKNDLKQFNCELFGFINYPKSCSLGFWKENVELIKGKIRKENNRGLEKENMISIEDKKILFKLYNKLKKEFENFENN